MSIMLGANCVTKNIVCKVIISETMNLAKNPKPVNN